MLLHERIGAVFQLKRLYFYQVIGAKLQGSLETQLFEAIVHDNRDALRRCLRVFATVDRIPDAQVDIWSSE